MSIEVFSEEALRESVDIDPVHVEGIVNSSTDAAVTFVDAIPHHHVRDANGELVWVPSLDIPHSPLDHVFEFERQQIATQVLRARPGETSDTLIIKTLPITDYPARPYEMARNAAVVAATGADMLVVGSPATIDSTRLSPRQRHGLMQARRSNGEQRSTFDRVGASMAHAASETMRAMHTDDSEAQDQPSLIIADFVSLGNNSGAAMLGHLPKNLQPDVVLWRENADPMLHPQEYGTFMVNFVQNGAKKADEYSAHTQASGLSGGRRDGQTAGMGRYARHGITNLWYYPHGIAGASIHEDLKTAHQDGRLPDGMVHVIISGTESGVSSPEADEALQGILVSQMGGVAVRMGIAEGTHLLYNDLVLNAASVEQGKRMALSS